MSEYHYTVEQDGLEVAAVFSQKKTDAQYEAIRYAETYEQDGPVKVFRHIKGKKIPIYFSEKGFV